MDLKNQLVVSSEDGTGNISITFDKPLRIPNKIALKSLYYPKFSEVEEFNVYLKDEEGMIFTLSIPVSGVKNSNDITWEVYSLIWDYCDHDNRITPKIIEYDERSVHSAYEPYVCETEPYDYVFLEETGLEIIIDEKISRRRSDPRNIFDRFEKGTVKATELGFNVKFHELGQIEQKSVLALIYCNVVSCTYMNSKTVQILDVVNLKMREEYNEITVNEPLFMDTVYDEVLTLTLSIKTLDGENIAFHNLGQPLVYKLIFR